MIRDSQFTTSRRRLQRRVRFGLSVEFSSYRATTFCSPRY